MKKGSAGGAGGASRHSTRRAVVKSKSNKGMYTPSGKGSGMKQKPMRKGQK